MKPIDVASEESIFKKVKKNIISIDSIKKENTFCKNKVSDVLRQIKRKINGNEIFNDKTEQNIKRLYKKILKKMILSKVKVK